MPLLYRSFFLVLTPTYYCYFSLCFWCQFQKFIIKTNVKDLPPLFPSKSCLISSLSFQSFVHLKVMLMYVVRWWSSLILWPLAVWFSQCHLLWRNCPCPIVSSRLFCHKWIDHVRVCYFWALCSVLLTSVFVLLCSAILYRCNSIWNQEVWCL